MEGRDDRGLDTLIDTALREATQPPAVDLKARVMAALDDRVPGDRAAEGPPSARASSGWGLAWRPAMALAALVVLAAASVLVFETRRAPQGPSVSAPTALSTTRALAPTAEGPARQQAAAASPTRNVAGGRARRGGGRASGEAPWDLAPVETAALSAEPHLPGAPAGQLGDSIAPMPSPPLIAFAPIQSSPTVSDIARPVTDFPADDNPPESPAAGAGKSGGARR